jgi:hypothetical protein
LAQPTTANAAGAACHSAPPPPADAELANAMLNLSMESATWL